MESKIEICPFCGSENVKHVEAIGQYWVECDSCEATGPWGNTMEESVELWNKAKR